ncbi:MAG: glycosyltransferase [Bacteroidia bacterium]
MFYKIKSLYELGYQITLHCFEYNDREITEELVKFCHKIITYKRNYILVNPLKFIIPMIVFTRNHKKLLRELQSNEAPILFEGLHTTYFINHASLAHRIKLVRTHNIEHDYYEALAQNENNFLKHNYFKIEANTLRKYEQVLHIADGVLAISNNDVKQLEANYNNIHLVNVFHGFNFDIDLTSNHYALYHGNLKVNENDVAAQYLINEIFAKIDYPLVIAGNNPTSELQKLVKRFKHISLVQNPNMEQMQELIQQAHLHVLPTFQSTGIKLKLLHVLYNGKFIVANKQMVENTGLESLVTIADSASEMIKAVNELKDKTFDSNEISVREKILAQHFTNADNAKKIQSIIQQLIINKV